MPSRHIFKHRQSIRLRPLPTWTVSAQCGAGALHAVPSFHAHPPVHGGWRWWRDGGSDRMRLLPRPHVPHSHQWGVRPGLWSQLLLRLRPMGHHQQQRGGGGGGGGGATAATAAALRALPQWDSQSLPQMRQCADRVPGRCAWALRRASTLRRRHRRRDTTLPTRQGPQPRAHGLSPLPPRSVRHQW